MHTDIMPNKRIGIDSLRGIAIIGIVLYHLFPEVFPGGFLGVPLFFVISGYLMITTAKERYNNNCFTFITGYYKKRIGRIYPALFTMIVVILSYLTLADIKRLSGIRSEIFSIFLGINNWWQISRNASYFSRFANASLFTHMWFLSLEIQFIIIWPVLFIIYNRLVKYADEKKMCFIFFAAAVISALRMFCLYIPGEEPSRVYYGTDTMAFSIFIGIFIGAAKTCCHILNRSFACKNRFYILSAVFAIIIILLFITVNGYSDRLYQGGMFIISLMFAVILNTAENNEDSVKNIPFISILAYIGRKSYIIYLWHYPVIILISDYMRGR